MKRFVLILLLPLSFSAISQDAHTLNGVPKANAKRLTTSATTGSTAPQACVSIMNYGGDPTDTNDNTSALTSALSASLTSFGQACVFFPQGVFKFTQTNTYTFPNSSTGTASVTLLGAGSEVTRFDFTANASFLNFNLISQYNSVHVRGVSITTNQQGSDSQGIVINQTGTSVTNPAIEPVSDISDVVLRGADGYADDDYWTNAIAVTGAGNINFNGVYAFGSSSKQGTGVNLSGSEYVIPVVFNFNSCGFVNLNTGLIYGNYVQGVTVSSSNFTHVQTGISSPSGETGLDQLTVRDSQIEASSAGINLNSGIASTIVTSTLFIVDNAANGVILNGCANCQFLANSFASGGGTPGNGIAIVGGVTPTTVVGNTFTNLTNGIFINASGTGANIQSNAYSGNTTNVGNLGQGNIIGGGSE